MKVKKHSTTGADKRSNKKIKKENIKLSKRITELTELLRADGTKSLLVIFQGMDASGKDGALRDTFYGTNQVNISVHSFKKPTPNEMAHDFLWRVHQVCPPKGMVQVFNRSQYEDILVPSVEKFIPKKVIKKRFDAINDFEEMLEENGTKVLKFYLNISKKRQEFKLTRRINVKEKHWKHNDGDWDVRAKFDDYMKVYEDIFNKCNKVPWHFVPADNSKVKVNIISKIIIKTLESMDLEYPALDSEKFTADYSIKY